MASSATTGPSATQNVTSELPPQPSPSAALSPPMVETYHNFFKQQRAMNFQNYLKLKKEEKLAMKKYHAAVLIQRVFRGWLIRTNMKLLHEAAIKIQANWKGAVARQRYKILDKERKEKKHTEMLNRIATKIQALWRGYRSRKNQFNFKHFKDLQNKNRRAQEQAQAASDLESMLSSSTIAPDEQARKTTSEMVESLANLLNTDLTKLAAKMSPSRVAQLYALAKSHQKEDEEGGGGGKRGSKLDRLAEYLNDVGRRKTIPHEESLAVMAQGGRGAKKDSSYCLFPDLPDTDDYYRPDPEKMQLLCEAVRLLRRGFQQEELNKLAKVHYLMRTAVIPGVYSDIYTNELTEMEKKLKDLKFYDKRATENYLKHRAATATTRAPVKEFVPLKMQSRSKYSINTRAQIRFQNKNFARGTCTPSSSLASCSSKTIAHPCSSNPAIISKCQNQFSASKLMSSCSSAWKPLSKC